MFIKILAAKYTLNGEFLGVSSVLGGEIQLCSDTEIRLNAAFVFGTYYSHSVSAKKALFFTLNLCFELVLLTKSP